MCNISFVVIKILHNENLRDYIPVECYYNKKTNMCKYTTKKSRLIDDTCYCGNMYCLQENFRRLKEPFYWDINRNNSVLC